MSSKIYENNIYNETDEIRKFISINEFEIIQDNMNGFLLIKNKDEIYLWNYYYNKKYNYNRIPIYFNHKIIYKQINSFDQNNIKISTKIRNRVLHYFKLIKKSNNIIGIGGEYYLYFLFLQYNIYIGMSNHKSIIEDAIFNYKKSINKLIDYNNPKTFIKLSIFDTFDVIINVFNLHENIIKYISSFNVENVIIISCKSLFPKIKLITKYFKLIHSTNIIYLNNYISIYLFKKI